jgi:hypothetical protein
VRKLSNEMLSRESNLAEYSEIKEYTVTDFWAIETYRNICANADDHIFVWSAIYSWTIADFQELLVPIKS